MSITLIIIIVTVIVSLMANRDPQLMSKLIFSPYQIYHRKEYYRFITHAFIHSPSNILHLFFNMYVLYLFGTNVEQYLMMEHGGKGRFYYLLLYFGGILFSSLRDYTLHKENQTYLALGASGAVSAILFAFIIISPTAGLVLLFLPFFPIPGFILGALYLWSESYFDKRGGTGIAHGAHLYGAIFGMIFIIFTDFSLVPSFFAQIGAYLASFF